MSPALGIAIEILLCALLALLVRRRWRLEREEALFEEAEWRYELGEDAKRRLRRLDEKARGLEAEDAQRKALADMAAVLESARRQEERERGCLERARLAKAHAEHVLGARLRGFASVDEEPLHDRIYIPAGQCGEFHFFAVPMHQADPYGPPRCYKSTSDTNGLIGGRLSDPESFEICGLSLLPDSRTSKWSLEAIRDDSTIVASFGGGSRHSWPTALLLADSQRDDGEGPSERAERKSLEKTKGVLRLGETLLIDHGECFCFTLKLTAPLSDSTRLKLILHGFHAKSFLAARPLVGETFIRSRHDSDSHFPATPGTKRDPF